MMSRISIVALVFLLACGQMQQRRATDGPQRVAEEWNEAMRRGDYGAMYDLTRPEDRAKLIVFELSILDMLGAGNEFGEQLAALRERHGLGVPPAISALAISDEEGVRRVVDDYIKSVPDERALYADVARAFRAIQPSVRFGEAVLWEIEDESASAFMGGKRVEFERVDGRWYLVADMQSTESRTIGEAEPPTIIEEDR